MRKYYGYGAEGSPSIIPPSIDELHEDVADADTWRTRRRGKKLLSDPELVGTYELVRKQIIDLGELGVWDTIGTPSRAEEALFGDGPRRVTGNDIYPGMESSKRILISGEGEKPLWLVDTLEGNGSCFDHNWGCMGDHSSEPSLTKHASLVDGDSNVKSLWGELPTNGAKTVIWMDEHTTAAYYGHRTPLTLMPGELIRFDHAGLIRSWREQLAHNERGLRLYEGLVRATNLPGLLEMEKDDPRRQAWLRSIEK